MLFLFNCFGCGFDLISIHYNEDSQQQCGFEIHCTSGEALLVQEAAASGQFTQQKRVLVYEWLFLVLACCFLPRIHDCKLNCSCWFIISLLGHKVGLLSNSSFEKQNNKKNNKKPLLLVVFLWCKRYISKSVLYLQLYLSPVTCHCYQDQGCTLYGKDVGTV